MPPAGFFERVARRVDAADSLLCVGLDPEVERMPAAFSDLAPAEAARKFCAAVVDATGDVAAAFKPNAAFFEQYGPEGVAALRDVIAHAKARAPVILDAKRGEIDNSQKAYARAVFDALGADAVTVNAYMGSDAVAPFTAYADRGVFILARTSNAGGRELQDLPDAAGAPFWESVARRAVSWNAGGNVGLVVGATRPDELARAREIVGEDMWFLVPGVGAQGGSPEDAVTRGGTRDGRGVLVNASRGILYAGDASPDAQRRAAETLRDALNRARR